MYIKNEPHLYIFTGHFGSGKTEVAVNFAACLKRLRPESKTALIDLDIINPFFRSADAKEKLEAMDVTVEAPLNANTNVDAPALTGKMGALIADTTSDVILDVGGDDLGARAVGYYSDIIKNRSHTIFFVMNSYRPFTSTLQSALKIYDEVEASAGLKINGIINNSNLLEDTCADTVTGGLELIKQVSDARNVPILIHTAMNRLLPELEKIFPGDMLLGMDEYVKLLFSRKS